MLQLSHIPGEGDEGTGKSVVSIHFDHKPSQKDQDEVHGVIREFLRQVVGVDPVATFHISGPTDDKEEANRKMRAFFGGGLG